MTVAHLGARAQAWVVVAGALAVIVALVTVTLVAGPVPYALLVPAAVAAGAVGWRAPGPVVTGLAMTAAGLGVFYLSGSYAVTAPVGSAPEPPPIEAAGAGPLALAATLLAGLAAGWSVQTVQRRRAGRAALAARRAAEATHTARGERARIARELHDVVAHHLSMISVQAETGRLTTAGLTPDGERRFREIGDTARVALTEMRRLLGVLREDAGGPAGRAPQPGIADLGALVADSRERGGVPASLVVRGEPVPVDDGTQLTAYRIVQEALTNVRRHAPGATASVEVEYAPRGLHVRVLDDGPGAPRPAAPPGHGLLGLRERVSMVGGTLRVGAGPRGGFEVEALLPVEVS